jgi:hypothetical protein
MLLLQAGVSGARRGEGLGQTLVDAVIERVQELEADYLVYWSISANKEFFLACEFEMFDLEEFDVPASLRLAIVAEQPEGAGALLGWWAYEDSEEGSEGETEALDVPASDDPMHALRDMWRPQWRDDAEPWELELTLHVDAEGGIDNEEERVEDEAFHDPKEERVEDEAFHDPVNATFGDLQGELKLSEGL